MTEETKSTSPSTVPMPSTDLESPRSPRTLKSNSEDRRPFSIWRKYTILFIVSWMTLAITYSSTSLLSATDEIASEFSTTTEIIDITNAGVLIAMGSSSFIWGPISEIVGRRNAYNSAIGVLLLCSIGSALARNMATFTAMRVLGGFVGTYFMVAGQTIIADVFEPTVRGTAVGFLMVGSVSGPAIGPCIGGIIVTFTSWRVIYWTQVGMVALGLLLSLFFVPQIQQTDKHNQVIHDEEKQPPVSEIIIMSKLFNPMRIIRPMRFPNVLLADIICGFLAIYQYGLLTSVRSTVNPRFNLTTPLISGLFYIAPGAGFLIGSIVDGRLSDRTVKLYIKKRNGLRVPQDRLNSGLLPLCFVLPVSILIYGWSLQEKVGGMALPIVAAFFGGVGLMGSFNGLNTYTAEVLPDIRAEVISGKYIIQYLFAAGSTAAALPVINAIGVGWASTICTCFVLLGGALVVAIAKRGLDMQKWAEGCFTKAGPLKDVEESV